VDTPLLADEMNVDRAQPVSADNAYVLVVEDDPSIRLLASRILQFNGISHGVAVDGADALAQVAARRPDLILMDLSMPGMDGREAIRRLRENPANAGVAIVALTAHAMAGDEQRALSDGFDAVLTKPYHPKELVQTIKQTLARVGSGGPA
jgi:CheY-like chemotaxis protein